MLAEAHFLTEGRPFTFELPEGLSRTPEIYGIVTTDAPRNLTYRPFELEDDPRTVPSLEHAFDLRMNGYDVSVFRSLERDAMRISSSVTPME